MHLDVCKVCPRAGTYNAGQVNAGNGNNGIGNSGNNNSGGCTAVAHLHSSSEFILLDNQFSVVAKCYRVCAWPTVLGKSRPIHLHLMFVHVTVSHARIKLQPAHLILGIAPTTSVPAAVAGHANYTSSQLREYH